MSGREAGIVELPAFAAARTGTERDGEKAWVVADIATEATIRERSERVMVFVEDRILGNTIILLILMIVFGPVPISSFALYLFRKRLGFEFGCMLLLCECFSLLECDAAVVIVCLDRLQERSVIEHASATDTRFNRD